MEGVCLEENPIEDFHAGVQANNWRKDRGSACRLAIDACTKRIIESVVQISLVLGTGRV